MNKFKMGDLVFWVESGVHGERKIPCPICCGKRFVTIILGDNFKEKIVCGACSFGFNPPCGEVSAYDPYSQIQSGFISGISTRNGVRYEIGYNCIEEHKLFIDEEDANKEREVQAVEVGKRAHAWREENLVSHKKNQVWSVGYHRRCIQEKEEQIEWHERKLLRIKEMKSKKKDKKGVKNVLDDE